jgi:hypothetical protein
VPVAEKTYSFKAPEELGERLQAARRTFLSFCHEAEADELIARQFTNLLMSQAHELEAAEENQSAFMRAVLLLMIAAVETAADERTYSAEFEAMARERDPEHEAFVRGALASASALWHEDA